MECRKEEVEGQSHIGEICEIREPRVDSTDYGYSSVLRYRKGTVMDDVDYEG
jgi:hypothetical protein